jgi:DNA-binding NarL/FixJ family response regulator
MTYGRIRVAVFVDDGRLRGKLRAMIGSSSRLQIESTWFTATQSESRGPGAVVDVIVCDDSPDTLADAQLAHRAGVGVIVMTDDIEVEGSVRELRSGLGLLSTDATREEVIAAIEAVSTGLFVVHPDLIHEDAPGAADGAGALPESLTPREVEVLHALAGGLGNKAIARELQISEHTAKFHVSQILAKLDAGSRTEAVSIAMRRGLLPL